MNKPQLPTGVFEDINAPILCIDDFEGSNSYSLKDIAKCSILPCENISLSALLGDENLNSTYVLRDAQASRWQAPPYILK